MRLAWLGPTALRLGYDVLRAALWPVGMGVRVMLVRDDRVLLVYHTYVDHWHFPGGGLKNGETVVEGASREVYEETGVVTTGELQLLGIYTGFGRGRTDQTAVFVCHEFVFTPPPASWEIVGSAFFGLDALPPDTQRGFRLCVRDYRAGGWPHFKVW